MLQVVAVKAFGCPRATYVSARAIVVASRGMQLRRRAGAEVCPKILDAPLNNSGTKRFSLRKRPTRSRKRLACEFQT